MQNSVDYGKAFSFVQEDPDWLKKILIGGVLSLIPVVGWILVGGYGLEVTRRVINGEAKVLPEWNDFGDLLKKGLFNFVVGLIYVLPIIVLAICIAASAGLAGAAGSDRDNNGALGALGGVISSCFGCLILIYALGVAVISPAIVGRLASTGEIGQALRVGEIVGMVRSNPGLFILTGLVAAIAAYALAFIGGLLCGIGALFTVPYGAVAIGHLYGQVYHIASGSPSSSATDSVQSAT